MGFIVFVSSCQDTASQYGSGSQTFSAGPPFCRVKYFQDPPTPSSSFFWQVSYAYQGYIYLLKNTVNTVILWNIVNLKYLFECFNI